MEKCRVLCEFKEHRHKWQPGDILDPPIRWRNYKSLLNTGYLENVFQCDRCRKVFMESGVYAEHKKECAPWHIKMLNTIRYIYVATVEGITRAFREH